MYESIIFYCWCIVLEASPGVIPDIPDVDDVYLISFYCACECYIFLLPADVNPEPIPVCKLACDETSDVVLFKGCG